MLSRQFSNLENFEIKSIKEFKSHVLGIDKVKFTPKSNHKFVSCSHDKSLKIWDVKMTDPVYNIENVHKEGIWDFDISSQNVIATISPDRFINLTDLKSRKQIESIEGDFLNGTSIHINQDRNQLLAGGQEGNLILIDIKSRKIIKKKPLKESIVHHIDVFDENWILSDSEGFIHLLDQNLNTIIKQKVSDTPIQSFALTDESIYLGNSEHKIIELFINQKDKLLDQKESFEGHVDEISSFQIDIKHKLLFTGSRDSSIFVWDMNKNSFKNNLVGHIDKVTSLDINPERSYLISSSWDQTCLLFKLNELI